MARFVRFLCSALVLSLLLTGCQTAPKAHDCQFVAMDTFMSLTAYGENAQTALTRAQEEILALDTALDVNNEKSRVYAINHRQQDTVPLSGEVGQLLSLSLELARETGGAFDPTIYPVVRKWGFTTGAYQLPTSHELEQALSLVGHEDLFLGQGSLTLKEGAQLDFGGIGKGWAGDRAAQALREQGIASAILRLGGNIQTLGTKPDGSLWTVGIQDPATGDNLATLAVADLSVVTSGSYQRYFTVNGQVYHHIIDPATGLPADNGLTSVTIIAPSGARCDALSTALFVMGPDGAARFWREHRDFEAVLVFDDGSVAITNGLQGNFTLTPAFSHRRLEVLE